MIFFLPQQKQRGSYRMEAIVEVTTILKLGIFLNLIYFLLLTVVSETINKVKSLQLGHRQQYKSDKGPDLQAGASDLHPVGGTVPLYRWNIPLQILQVSKRKQLSNWPLKLLVLFGSHLRCGSPLKQECSAGCCTLFGQREDPFLLGKGSWLRRDSVGILLILFLVQIPRTAATVFCPSTGCISSQLPLQQMLSLVKQAGTFI